MELVASFDIKLLHMPHASIISFSILTPFSFPLHPWTKRCMNSAVAAWYCMLVNLLHMSHASIISFSIFTPFSFPLPLKNVWILWYCNILASFLSLSLLPSLSQRYPCKVVAWYCMLAWKQCNKAFFFTLLFDLILFLGYILNLCFTFWWRWNIAPWGQ